MIRALFRVVELLVAFSACALAQAKTLGFVTSTPIEAAMNREVNRQRFDDFMKREHVGIELLVAEGSTARLWSVLGHLSLRFIDLDDNDQNDNVVGYMMPIIGQNAFEILLKGKDGGWENVPFVLTLAETVVDYTKQDQRFVKRIIIPVDETTITKIKMNLLMSLQEPDIIGDYKFISNNCATAMYRLLSESGLKIDGHPFFEVPAQAENNLRLNFLNPFPPLYIRGAQDLISNVEKLRYKCPGRARGKACKYTNGGWISDQNVSRYLETLASGDLERLFFFWPEEWESEKIAFANLVRLREPSGVPLEDLIHLEKVPKSIYRLCSPEGAEFPCPQEWLRDLLSVWPAADLLTQAKDNELIYVSELRRAKQLATWKEREAAFHSKTVTVQYKLTKQIINLLEAK